MASYLDDKFSIDSDKHNWILREKNVGKKEVCFSWRVSPSYGPGPGPYGPEESPPQKL